MSTMRVSEASPDAVDFVMENLWQRGQEELAILGIETEVARGIIAHQRAIGMPNMAIWIDDEPVIICGVMRTDHPHGMATWFQATEMFTPFMRPITAQLRESLERTALAFGLEFLEIISPCVHPKTGRWFRALGFALDLDRYIQAKDGVNRLYRYERKFSGGASVLRQS